jgi:NAD(P)H dehydrogenase (quinone)
MHVLVVLCHPLRSSYCASLVDRFNAGLTRSGHTSEVADLHAEGFDPVFGARDFLQFEGGIMPCDVLTEQARVDRCDALAFVSPVWWLSLPALLKGWFDRVWSNGWAYEWAHDPEGSLLPRRPFAFMLTAAGSASTWKRMGYDVALETLLRVRFLGWCGVSDSTIVILHDTGFDQAAMAEHASCIEQLGEMLLDGGSVHWPASATVMAGTPRLAVRGPVYTPREVTQGQGP